MDVKPDGFGNIYLPGNFSDTVDFDPGPGVVELTSNGGQDVFISKFDSDGILQWVCTWGSTDYDYGGKASVDVSGSIFQVGIFNDTVDIGADEVVTNPVDLNDNGIVDYFELAVLTDEWLQSGGELQTDFYEDGFIDFADYALFAEQWLWTGGWYE